MALRTNRPLEILFQITYLTLLCSINIKTFSLKIYLFTTDVCILYFSVQSTLAYFLVLIIIILRHGEDSYIIVPNLQMSDLRHIIKKGRSPNSSGLSTTLCYIPWMIICFDFHRCEAEFLSVSATSRQNLFLKGRNRCCRL